jgi:hypothetical protein
MKTILAIWHIANQGKTATLREFANLLIATYPNYRPIVPIPIHIPTTGDFRLIVEINGKIIGIESQGDPNTNLGRRLLDLADNFHCDIILCSTRTKGDTIDAVDHLFYNRGFQTIWTSTYQVATNHQLANQTKARHLLDLLQTLSLI